MAVQIKTQYRRATDNTTQNVTVTADIVDFRPRGADREQVGVNLYLKVSAGVTGIVDWYRKMNGHISDALRGYKLGIDGGTSVDAANGGTPATSLSIDGYEGVLTQLEKPAAPTFVDATAIGGGGVHIAFVAPVVDEDVLAGYYFFHSTDCETWTRLQAQTDGSGLNTGCVAKGYIGDEIRSAVAVKAYDLISVPTGSKYIGVTCCDSASATSEFAESNVASYATAITVS